MLDQSPLLPTAPPGYYGEETLRRLACMSALRPCRRMSPVFPAWQGKWQVAISHFAGPSHGKHWHGPDHCFRTEFPFYSRRRSGSILSHGTTEEKLCLPIVISTTHGRTQISPPIKTIERLHGLHIPVSHSPRSHHVCLVGLSRGPV